jgi:hypothetical protein
MGDGNLKLIEDIRRGDQVANNHDRTKTLKVSRINHNQVYGDKLLDIVEFLPGSLELNQPNQKLIITTNHPIFYENARRPVKCFKNLSGVNVHYQKLAKEILEMDPDQENRYSLYDLQFDYDSSYVANNLTIQSRSPYRNLTPLPKELYFDDSLWMPGLVCDSFNQVLPLDLNPSNQKSTEKFQIDHSSD